MAPRTRLILFLAVVVTVLMLALVWGVGGQGEWPAGRIEALAGRFAGAHWLPWAVFGAVVVGLQIAIPQLLLVPVGVIVLGPWAGFAVVYLGTLVGAVIGYLIGRHLGRRPIRRLYGPRMKRLSRSLAKRGVRSMIVVNMLPIVSQTLINLAAGTTHIRFRDFLLGTAIGIMPPTLVVVIATHLLLKIGRLPTFGEAMTMMLVVFLAALALWFLTRKAWDWLSGS
jgi:uncharacterized membrane protein YdjX (TVP38/TMEM64 family)